MSPEPDRVETAFEGVLLRVDVERWPRAVRREVVRHPGSCGAVVLVGDGVLLVRQFREAVRRHLLEIPAGIYDVAGETADRAVRREIEEETGYRATVVDPLGRILTSPGFTDEAIDLFLAEAEPGGQATEEGVEAVVVPFDEAAAMVLSGEIEDAKTAVAILLAALQRGEHR